MFKNGVVANNDEFTSALYPITNNEGTNHKIQEFIKEETNDTGEYSSINISYSSYTSIFTIIKFDVEKYEQSTNSREIGVEKESKYFVTVSTSTVLEENSVEDTQEDMELNEPSDKTIALTFDDGPHEQTSQIVNLLNSYNVKSTFYIIGSQVKGYAPLITQMHNSGHEIANHTYNHKRLTSLSKEDVYEEIEMTQQVVHEVTGEYPSSLRPTFGAMNSQLKQISHLPLVLWTVDSRDWSSKDSNSIFNIVTKDVKDGDIVLFHDTYTSTYDALKLLLPYLIEQGYNMVTVNQLFSLNNEQLVCGKAYFSRNVIS